MLTFPKRGALRYPWCTRYPERKIYIQVPQDTYGDIHQNQEKLENRGSKNHFPSLLKFDISQILSKCNFYSSLSFKVHFLINLLSYWQKISKTTFKSSCYSHVSWDTLYVIIILLFSSSTLLLLFQSLWEKTVWINLNHFPYFFFVRHVFIWCLIRLL